MIIYILMLVVSLLFASLIKEKNSNKLNKLYICLSAFPFFIVSALRYDVGTDYMFRYTRDFIRILTGGVVNDLEIGFKILYKICIFITNDSQSIFVLTSFIITLFIFNSIYKYSKNIKLSIVLFFIGTFFFQSLNLTREYICISLMLFSYKYLLDNQIIKWSFWMLIATVFHSTSLLFIGLSLMFHLIIRKDKYNNIVFKYRYMIGILISIFLLGPLIKESIFSYISFTRFKVYLGSKFDYGDLQIIPFTINLLLLIWMAYIAKKKKIIDIEDKYFIYMQFIGVCIIAFGNYIYLINRVSYYFTIFQVLSIPYFLSQLKGQINYRKYLLHLISIIIIFSTSLVWTHVINNTDEVLPYKSIINLE